MCVPVVRTLVGAQQGEAGGVERVLKDAVEALARLICERATRSATTRKGGWCERD